MIAGKDAAAPADGGVPLQPIVIFLHNQKTGGTTLERLAGRQYRPEEIIRASGKGWTIRPSPGVRPEHLRLIYGHIPFGLHQALPRPAAYVTLLRHPIERVASLYHHALANPGRSIHRHARGHLGSIEEFVESGTVGETDNGQVRRLSGLHARHGECTREMLDRAKCHLCEHCVAFGITERFDESIVLLRRTLGWHNVFYYRHERATGRPAREALSSRTTRVIERFNALDIELHAYASKLFADAFDRLGDEAVREVQTVQAVKRALARRAAGGGVTAWDLGEVDAETGIPTAILDAYVHYLEDSDALQRDQAMRRHDFPPQRLRSVDPALAALKNPVQPPFERLRAWYGRLCRRARMTT